MVFCCLLAPSIHLLLPVWSSLVPAVYSDALVRHGTHSPHHTEYDPQVLPPAALASGRLGSVAFPTRPQVKVTSPKVTAKSLGMGQPLGPLLRWKYEVKSSTQTGNKAGDGGGVLECWSSVSGI